jgi:hypothetical protein
MNVWVVKPLNFLCVYVSQFYRSWCVETQRWGVYLATFAGINIGTCYIHSVVETDNYSIVTCRCLWNFWLALFFAFGQLWEFPGSFYPFYLTWRQTGILFHLHLITASCALGTVEQTVKTGLIFFPAMWLIHRKKWAKSMSNVMDDGLDFDSRPWNHGAMFIYDGFNQSAAFKAKKLY